MDRRLLAPIAAAGLLGLFALATGASRSRASLPLVTPAHAEDAPQPAPAPGPEVAKAPQASPAALPPREAADAHLDRSWRAPLAGGLLVFPPSFHSEDGTYDLVLHLNGNTDLVEESYGYAGLNAVVVILNLGVGSGVYEDRFAVPGSLQLILDRAQSVMMQRGLRNAKLGRLALAGWSSGYGGVVTILDRDGNFDRVSAIMLFDSIHCGFDTSWPPRLKSWQIEPIRAFARKAVEGKAMLSITHSEIETYGYLNAHKTTDAVLAALGLSRSPASTPQPMPVLTSMIGVLPKAQMVPLPPLTEVHRGDFHVRGYGGTGPVTHMLHLVQMSTTAVPDLVRFWKR